MALLVTSAPDEYWQAGQLTEAVNASPSLRIDEGVVLQEWLGFGGAFNEAGWDALAVLTATERVQALELLFDAKNGARLSYGRMPIGASDYALERYTLSERADDYAMESFSIERDRQRLIPYVKAALRIQPGLRLLATPWTPPAWMKQNSSTDGGRIRDEPKILQAYALYFARFIEEYAAEGITISSVQPQNEPGFEQSYPTCLWTPELLSDFVGGYLGPTLNERRLPTEIWFGAMSAPADDRHVNVAMADATAARFIKGIGVQWNTLSAVPGFVSNYGLPVMQTEHRAGNYPWQKAKFNPTRAPNDHAYAEESWGLIAEWIRAGVNAYLAWNMVLDTRGLNLDERRPWPQNALLTVDRATRTLHATPAYFVFRHLSRFVEPGARRVGTSGDADALAFRNSDGSISTVVYNSSDAAKEVTLEVRSDRLRFTTPAHGWATVYVQ
jgi:glucosylceramidase